MVSGLSELKKQRRFRQRLSVNGQATPKIQQSLAHPKQLTHKVINKATRYLEFEVKEFLSIAFMAAVNSTVKYGIIGVGMMGREHLINLHHLRSEGVTVVAIADPHVPSQELALELAHSFDWQLKVLLLDHFNNLADQEVHSPCRSLAKVKKKKI